MADVITTRRGLDVHVAGVTEDDQAALHDLFNRVLEESGGYPHEPPVDEEEFRGYWLEGKTAVVVATVDGALVGSYFLKPNFPGRASHIGNCGYIVSPDWQGKGIGRALVEHSLELAAVRGFDALQFNLVFESNPARPMYEDLGFEEVGRVPAAVGGEDAVVYYRQL